MPAELTDAEVIRSSLNDPAAFATIFERHFAAVYRYLERRLGRDDADELAGEVLRLAFEHRDKFRPLHDSALPWLFGIATNLVLRHRRSERRRLRALARFEGGTLPAEDEYAELERRLDAQRSQVMASLARLDDRDRDVVVLVAWEDLSYEEVAVVLNIPVGTVRSRLNRARRTLRELLAADGNERTTIDCELTDGQGS